MGMTQAQRRTPPQAHARAYCARPARATVWVLVVVALLLIAFGVGLFALLRGGFGPALIVEQPYSPTFHAPMLDRYRALMTEGQPPTGDNFAELADQLAAITAEVDEKAGLPRAGPGAPTAYVDYDAFQPEFRASAEHTQDAERAAARAALTMLEQRGAFDLIARLANAPRYQRELPLGALVALPMPNFRGVRAAARIARARVAVAAETGAPQDIPARVRELIAIGAATAREPTLIAALTGVAIQNSGLAMFQNRRALASFSDADLAALADILASARVPDPVYALRGEELLALDTVADVYTHGLNALTRLQGGPPAAAMNLGVLDRARMPGLEAETANATAYYAGLRDLAARPATQRTAPPREDWDRLSTSVKDSLILGLLIPAVTSSQVSMDQHAADMAGARVAVAIERCRRARGAEPETLAALVPEFLDKVPTDPYTGGELGYRPPSKGPYADGRTYLLYAAGADGVDNGGAINAENRFLHRDPKTRQPIPGTDLLLAPL